MTRYSGNVGFGESVEDPEGSSRWVNVITERLYYGDVPRNTRRLDLGDSINGRVSVGNSISIVADGYALEHELEIKYVYWKGKAWVVDDVQVERPRLILSLGAIYKGPFPEPEAP